MSVSLFCLEMHTNNVFFSKNDFNFLIELWLSHKSCLRKQPQKCLVIVILSKSTI